MAAAPRIGVIGGGVMGLACALRLAQRGAAVWVFESRACGQGATLAALGALWPSGPLQRGPFQELHRAALWQFEAFLRDLGAAGVAVPFRRAGRLEFLNSSKIIPRAKEEAQAACRNWPDFMGEGAMEYLDAAQVAKTYPHLAPAMHGALLCRSTSQVGVHGLVAALKAACMRAGVTLLERTRVHALRQKDHRITAVETDQGVYVIDAALVTAGAWTPMLSQEIAGASPIRPAKGQGLALGHPSGVRLDKIVKSGPIYLVPWVDEILVGSTTEPEAGFDEAPSEEGRRLLLRGAAAILPALQDASVIRHWTGLRPQNSKPGHPPIMGPHPAIPNLYLCTGHFKTGIGLAPLVSTLMAAAILEEHLPPALKPFAPRV